MHKLFISYRRKDSQNVADRIHDHMLEHFGEGNVFQDVDEIPFGVDFRRYILKQINKTNAMLVIIGKDWIRFIKEHPNPATDFVRYEVRTALQDKNMLVVPVLVNGAQMPLREDLPEEIQSIVYLNAARVRPNPDFKNDCEVLANGVIKSLEIEKIQPRQEVPEDDLPRSAPDILPPPFEWLKISEGRVKLEKGMTLKHDVTLSVPRFEISKYPITNAQFKKFVEAGGYGRQKYWTDFGWRIQEEKSWRRPDVKMGFNRDNQPVVGVSFHEVIAFTNWLSEITGDVITLPSEKQWQRAAQGDDNRKYPWGNDFNNRLCQNSVADRDNRQTSTVTEYEGKGDSPFGVVDMVGNVWEWCLDKWHLDTRMGNREIHSVRGASYNVKKSELFRVTLREGFETETRMLAVGFRIVRRIQAE